jgi:serine/threonine-protein kinase
MTIKQLNNRYQVIQVLGAGGFGETFLAEDTYMPSRRRCVIKQLKPITKNPQIYKVIQQRFEREAATLEYLGEGSEQIPKLYAYFCENGKFYLVQEWIQGQTLTNIVKARGPLQENQVREILLSLLSVLDYVHSKGIIHRDIKPDNIIIRATDSKPVLIDFGAVKETIRSVVTGAGHLTQSLVIGTPGYMPGEQAAGRPVYATDIYSLGLTTIYLLTGKSPQEFPTDLQTGEILWQQFASDISPQFIAVLNQAIKPHASDRYSSASKMLHALQSISSLPSIPSHQSTQSTIALSPPPAPTHTPVSPQQPQSPLVSASFAETGNGQKAALIFTGLVVGSLISGIAFANFTHQQQPQTEITTSPTPQTTKEPTTTTTTAATTANPSPVPSVVTSTSEPKNPQKAIASPPSVSVTTLTPEPQKSVTFVPTPQQELPVQEELETSAGSTSKPQTQPAPEEDTASVAPPKLKKQKEVATTNIGDTVVPGFPTGTSENTIVNTLGKPSKVSRGLWNTRAYLYRLQPNRVDLGYLFDRRSGILRQTEVAFAQSVPLETMQSTLQGMLAGNASSAIQQGLEKVYQRQINEYSFRTGGLKGVIQRNEEDQIYIGVWDADLH